MCSTVVFDNHGLSRFSRGGPKHIRDFAFSVLESYRSFLFAHIQDNEHNKSAMSTKYQTSTIDTCALKCCTYPNGTFVLATIQILLLTAFLLSCGAIFDCKFVMAEITEESGIGGLTDGKRLGLGFLTHEDGSDNASHTCRWQYWEDKDENGDAFVDSIVDYHDWLGSDWNEPRALAGTAAILAALMLGWAITFSCLAQVRPFRYLAGIVCVFVVSSVQLCTLKILSTDFCGEHECDLGRSAALAIGAGVLFLLAGILFFFTNDFSSRNHDAECLTSAELVKGNASKEPSIPEQPASSQSIVVEEVDLPPPPEKSEVVVLY